MAKILVTDDEADMRLALINTLELAGYAVEDAGSGKAALDRLRLGGIDLVLLDIRLPDMDGVQILRRIKKEHPQVPVIMVTGFGSLETAVKTVQMGASDYISKPFENKDLFQRIEKALGSREIKAPPGPITSRLLSDLGVESKPAGTRDAQAIRAADPPRTKRWIALALALVAAGAAGLGYYRWQAAGETALGIPTSHLSGMTATGENIWLSDWFGQTVFECKIKDDQLVVHRSYHLPDARPAGIAFSGDALYVADAWARTLSKRALDDTLSVISSTASPAAAPAGVFWDGSHLWSTDTEADSVFRHSAEANMGVQKRFAAAGTAPVGLCVYDGKLWIADADTRKVYVHNIDENYSLEAAYTHPLLKDSTRPLSAFMIAAKNVWFGFEGDNKVHRIRLSLMEKI